MEGDKFCFHWTQLELGPNIPIEGKKKKKKSETHGPGLYWALVWLCP